MIYPVYLRDILNSRYQVLSKLGYGSCSTPLAEFELPGAEGSHQCFVLKPLTIDLVATRDSVYFDEVLFKTVAFYVFRALEFLHNKTQMVHCGTSLLSWRILSCNINQDLRAKNFCLTALDQSTFRNREVFIPRHAKFTATEPSTTELVIYFPKITASSTFQCYDFGEARFGQIL